MQRVLDCLHDRDQLSSLAGVVGPGLETVLGSGCTGVLLSLVRACVRLGGQQAAVLAQLTAALHCQVLHCITLCLY